MDELGEARDWLRSVAREHRVRAMVESELAAVTRLEREPRWTLLDGQLGHVLQLFVWPTGARTAIHDHTSWGVYLCLRGRLSEERYVRLDDEAELGIAHLELSWQRIWRPGEHSTVRPYAGGIHRVANAGLAPAVSLHLYGPRVHRLLGEGQRWTDCRAITSRRGAGRR